MLLELKSPGPLVRCHLYGSHKVVIHKINVLLNNWMHCFKCLEIEENISNILFGNLTYSLKTYLFHFPALWDVLFSSEIRKLILGVAHFYTVVQPSRRDP